MTKKYRKFDAAFKLNVCKLIVDQGQSVNSVCLDMNLSDTAVRRWVEQYKAELATPISRAISRSDKFAAPLLAICSRASRLISVVVSRRAWTRMPVISPFYTQSS